MKSTVAQSAGVSRSAGRRVEVRIFSWIKIDSDEAGEEKSLYPEEVRLVTEALGADRWPTEIFQSLTFVFLLATPILLVAPRRRVPGE
jgi:hypothetical protein